MRRDGIRDALLTAIASILRNPLPQRQQRNKLRQTWMQIITGTFQKNRLSPLGKQQLGANLHLHNIQLGIQIRFDYTLKKSAPLTQIFNPTYTNKLGLAVLQPLCQHQPALRSFKWVLTVTVPAAGPFLTLTACFWMLLQDQMHCHQHGQRAVPA